MSDKLVGVWLAMATDAGAQYPIPTSELSYTDNISAVDIVNPYNGGRLLSDGSWYQMIARTQTEWPQLLPTIAQQNGHRYMPVVSSKTVDDLITVLNSSDLQLLAANNLIELATTRYDAMWDGVLVEFEGVPAEYRNKMSDFLYLLSYKIRSTGMQMGMSIHGHMESGNATMPYDLTVIGQIADIVAYYCYGYWRPLPQSLAPHWWIDECIQYALNQGIPAQRLMLGVPVFSKYWETASGPKREITYSQAIDIVHSANTMVQWIEKNENGLVRERFADVGEGYIWIQDGDTLRHNLALVDKYGLAGVNIFLSGMESVDVWDLISEWIIN